jgi:polysaccharide export outer membrane protein
MRAGGGLFRTGTGSVLAAVACLLVVGACAPGPKGSPLPQEPANGLGPPYRVGPSDELLVRVLPEPVIEQKVKVGPDGRFSMDLIGDVDAAGHTTDEIAHEINKRMEVYRQSPSTSVALLAPSSTAITVLGEVKKPETFPLERPIRVSEAVAKAGGATTLAATSRIRVIHHPRDGEAVVYIVNLDAIQGGKAQTNVLIQRGDLVYVPAAVPVVIGYKLQRALYPVFQVTLALLAPFMGFLIHP